MDCWVNKMRTIYITFIKSILYSLILIPVNKPNDRSTYIRPKENDSLMW